MPKSVNAWDSVFANKDGAGVDEGKVRSKHGGHSPVAVKVQKETQEQKKRAAFQVRENSSQFMQMLFQHFEHVRQDLKA